MIRIFIILIFSFIFSFGVQPSVQELKWPSGLSLLKFFEDENIPLSLYYNLEREDQELASEIISGATSYIVRDSANTLQQALIPISDELQIQIYKDKFGEYQLDFTPIIYTSNKNALGIEIKSSPYADIIAATGNKDLANAFVGVFKQDVNFKKLQKGDRLVILYEEKTRLGRPFGSPQILASMVEENKKSHYLYFYDSKFYDENGKKVEAFFLITPVKGARISSRFTLKRFHPVLKRYRAHLGVDYAAPRGTIISAAGSGKISFIGKKGGYGNVMEISHGDGFTTLYAHLKGFAKGMKKGLAVKQGQTIAYIGNTGLSTGPHLHFGVYQNNKAIDPLKVVAVTKARMASKEEREFKKLVRNYNKEIQNALGGSLNPNKFEDFDSFIRTD